jgi:hypothetical protein
MMRCLSVALLLAGCLSAAPLLSAQTPPGSEAPGSGSTKPADAQKTSAPTPQSGTNPFPEDTTSVPVLPSKGTPVLPEGTYTGADDRFSGARESLSGDDADPVHSPDDPAPPTSSGQEQDSSSSLSGLDKVLPPPDDEQTDKKRRKEKEPTHQEAAASDIDVGSYYLDRKNWKAALSRFESAMVLDPENPEVYWGLAEAERHLGDFADARAYYSKLLDYDPDGPHGKQARKALKDPALTAARSPSLSQPLPETQR